jgi:small subunit ribosomal protein S19e
MYRPCLWSNHLFISVFIWGGEKMTTVYDVEAEPLIKKLAERMAEDAQFSPPEWAKWVKTGVHRERLPDNPNWWSIRVAAILRKIYLHSPIGTERLRTMFGGARDRRSKPNKARKGSGSIVRKALQQLEAAGLVTTIKGKGRVITPKGQAFLDNTAHTLEKQGT